MLLPRDRNLIDELVASCALTHVTALPSAAEAYLRRSGHLPNAWDLRPALEAQVSGAALLDAVRMIAHGEESHAEGDVQALAAQQHAREMMSRVDETVTIV